MWGGDLTFFQNLQSNVPAHGQIIPFKCNQISSPHAAHCTVKYLKAGSKKGTIKISPNKTLQSLFILCCCITKDTAANIRFNHNPCYTAKNTETFRRKSIYFVSLNIPFLVKGTKKVSFISLQSL